MRLVKSTFYFGIVALLLTSACGSTGASDTRGRTPSQVMSYRGADWLERSSRAIEEEPDRLVEIMDLETGDVVADIGAGTGYFSRRIARRVAPAGKVYAVEIQPQMLDRLNTMAQQAGLENIVPILSGDDDPRLPAGRIDKVLLVDVYHEFQQPEAMLAKIREALSPRGKVYLAEYRLEGNTARHIRRDHRMSVEQVLAEWEPAGFELVELDSSLPTQHLFIFEATALKTN
jgi:ubiquinone/menaquinone biosynthesis C-methylase UbiE